MLVTFGPTVFLFFIFFNFLETVTLASTLGTRAENGPIFPRRENRFLCDFRTAFGKAIDNVPEPIHVVGKDWSKDIWARGVLTATRGTRLLADEPGKAIAAPFGDVHSAGTETVPV